MKKIFVLVIILIINSLFSFNASSALIDILQKKGGQIGEDGKVRFNEVNVVDAILIRIVKCQGAGVLECPENGIVKGATEAEMNNINEAREFARAQILNNFLSGQHNLPSGLTVKWFSLTNNPNNCGECEIKIWTTGEPEPNY